MKKKEFILGCMLAVAVTGCSMGTSHAVRNQNAGLAGPLSTGFDRDVALEQTEERLINAQNWREVEMLLAEEGFNPGSADGKVDDRTRQALKDYQRYKGLNVTGILDDRTLFYMQGDGARFTGSFAMSLSGGEQVSD